MFKMLHTKCRGAFYPFTEIKRLLLNDKDVPWSSPLNQYHPPDYDAPVLKNKPWADPPLDDGNFHPKWNNLDGSIDRRSHLGHYQLLDGRPLNPCGRTGLKGRGVLGKWGPNHAADPIVTKWKRLNGETLLHKDTNLPILQFCAIQRHDCGQWAIPGGMVDPGERISETLKREFLEEALEGSDETNLQDFFQTEGEEIYRGYVDDPRNTDNAWMETVAVNFHDENDAIVGKFKLQAGDDAKSVQWMDLDKKLQLYASHSQFLESVTKLRQAHW